MVTWACISKCQTLNAHQLGTMSFKIGPLCTSMINTLYSKHKCNLPFIFGTRMKLLHCSGASSTSNGTIICCLWNLSSYSLSGCCSAYAILLGGSWYWQLLYLTLSLKTCLYFYTGPEIIWHVCVILVNAHTIWPVTCSHVCFTV